MKKWEKALSLFCDRCKEHGVDFYLIGSVSASARGVDIEPHDIDAVVDIHDLPALRQAFEPYITEPIAEGPADGVVRYFGKLALYDFAVEISSMPQNKYGRHPIELFCWNGHILKAQSLDLLYKVYRNQFKTDYCKAIECFWDSMEI